jgi:hypothetical protein
MILELLHRRPDGDVDTYHLKPGRRYHLGRGSSCEVRILDLKLSRKHAAIEYLDEAWTLIDLCSTNGCLLNGGSMVGTAPLVTGATIEIGQTTLVIGTLLARDGAKVTPPAALAASPAVTAAPPKLAEVTYASDEFRPGDQQSLAALQPSTPLLPPRAPNNRPQPTPIKPSIVRTEAFDLATPVPAAPEARPVEPVAAEPVAAEPVAPEPLAAEPVAAEPLVVDLEATVATLPLPLPMPAKPAPPAFVQPKVPTPLSNAPDILPAAIPAEAGEANAANSNDRSYFITVLGRRIGPLSRLVARDLKARELKGTLLLTDLAPYPSA